MEIAIPVITLLLGVVLGAWYTVYLKRPRLRVTGSGGGGGSGPGFHANHVRVTNQPGFLGIRIPQTVLFGKRLYKHFEKGLTVDRSAGAQCQASIYDKRSGMFIAPLWWRDTGAVALNTVTIESGQGFDLLLFARLAAEPTKYFVYAPANQGASSPPNVPREDVKFDDTREFFVRVAYSYGRQRLEFDTTMRKGFDGRMSYEVMKGGGGSF